MAKLVPGVNDLATTHPNLAKEAYCWDPTTVTRGSNKLKEWWCEKGHPYKCTVKNKSLLNVPCGVCAGKQVLVGFNDLATTHPELAREAYQWDARTVTAGCNSKKLWWCPKGHPYPATVDKRVAGRSCGYCAGRKVLVGYNDLATTHPEVAATAHNWDPKTVSRGSHTEKEWWCEKGHPFKAPVKARALEGTGCGVCEGYQLLVGVNDLATTHPLLAAQAYGWDPRTVTKADRKQKRAWWCDKGHPFHTHVETRAYGGGCGVCRGLEVCEGVNDLASQFPELAAEADEWEPRSVTTGSNRKKKWKCGSCGHRWGTTVSSRTKPGGGSGCPKCAKTGFDTSKEAWFYLFERPGEQQLGVTNRSEGRFLEHERAGWSRVDVVGPLPGEKVLETEQVFKQWLRREVGLVPGSHENWFTVKLEVKSLAELKARSGVDTDLF